MNTARLPSQRPRMPHRRQELRFPARLPATLLSSRAKDRLITLDVSFRGMFLLTERPLEVRQLVRLGVVLPVDGRELVVHGMVVNVVRTHDPEGRPQGMGVELYAVDAATRAAWWDVVRCVRDDRGEADQESSVRLVGSLIPLHGVEAHQGR